MTIYEIAKKAGVSIATISRAMNPQTREKVSPATLKKIDEIVKKSAYTPNVAARNLGGASFKTIGVVLPHLKGIFFSDYYAQLLSGVADTLLDTDYHFKMITLKAEDFKWDHYDFRSGEGVDGIIITHWPHFFSSARAIEKLTVPCVVINDPETGARAHFATCDNTMGGEIAARYLYSKAHRRIAILAGPDWSADSRLRIQGFRDYLKRMSPAIAPDVLPADFQEDKAGVLAEAYFRKNDQVTAFFCCNDLMAFGVIRALKKIGIHCPRDISIVGYDDDCRAENFDPPLTTIRAPHYDLTKEGTRRLVRYLKKEEKEEFFKEQTVFPVELVERHSVKQL
jgi:DNA-binding LacI/PurR family transcriptional regulator